MSSIEYICKRLVTAVLGSSKLLQVNGCVSISDKGLNKPSPQVFYSVSSKRKQEQRRLEMSV